MLITEASKVTHLHNETPQIQRLPLVLVVHKNSVYTLLHTREAQLEFLSPKYPNTIG